ncbi:MAG: uroporphyrinogen decarboxylase [Nitrospirota bacterium]|nr:MAG: uroporphyrinogen decarboxylase [Nitrospirota bacterium]
MNDTFLKACRGEEVKYTPIWIMRQAGRYLPDYQKVRSKVDFLTLCKTPELAAEVTIQPIDILGVDAAILFSDILIPLEPMGLKLRFLEKKGPVFSNPVRDRRSVEKLIDIEPEEDVPFVLDTIRILRRELAKKVPLIGFAGAPFTLATYMIEGGSSKTFLNTKRMMYQNPPLFMELMERITDNTVAYLSAQIDAGAQAIQIFDSWAGALSPADYERYSLPFVKDAVKVLKKKGVPIIYFVNNCAGILDIARKAGSDVLGIDWRIDMAKAAKQIGKKRSIQGNLDPLCLFMPRDSIREAAKDILSKASSARGHIFNLGHGIIPETPVDGAKALVDAVHEISSK